MRHIETQEVSGLLFMHLKPSKLTKQVYKELKEDVESIRQHAKDKGYTIVFAATDNERMARIYPKLSECYTFDKLEDSNVWLASWET